MFDFCEDILYRYNANTKFSVLSEFETKYLSDEFIDGFDIDELQKGMGLQNIDSRIKSINGSAKWKSEKSYGTRLIMKI